MTSERSTPRLAKWPFFLGDLLLLSLAGVTVEFAARPMTSGLGLVCAACVAAGGWLAVTPFLLEYRAATKLAETDRLATTVAQIKNLDRIAGQINTATNHWQSALDQSAKTVTAANEIAERMTAEAKAFADFMQKANDSEKAHLRLEVDKLRRAEGEWLQILTHIFDHVYAVCSAAERSGQPRLAQQLGHFQNACRDAARRIGLVPFSAEPASAFDANLHQPADPNGEPPADARVADTVATGFTYQGKLLRKAVVTLHPPGATVPVPEPPASAEPASIATSPASPDSGTPAP